MSGDKIIGGMFGLEVGATLVSSAPFLSPPNMETLLLVNGRSALAILVEKLSSTHVWLPSYLCPVLVTAVGDRAPIHFYPVDEHLQIQPGAWVKNVRPGDLFLFIDYFGFLTEMEWLQTVADRGAYVVRDASQALLTTTVAQGADFVIYSPRKFVGVPDGGVLLARNDELWADLPLQAPPAAWWLRALRASQLRAQFDVCGHTREWYPLFRETEDDAPIGPYRMSELSQNLLAGCFDYTAVARQRRQNYQTLLAHLAEIALFPGLPPSVVPLGFPIRLTRRDEVRQRLFAHEIYPPVHWPLADIVPPEFSASHTLAQQLMTLPCDQRYMAQDMVKIGNIISKELHL